MMSAKLREWLIKLGDSEVDGTQESLAKTTGLTQGHISKIISGTSRSNARINTIQRIANHMGVEVWRLVWAIETGSLLEQPNPGPRGEDEKPKGSS